MINHATRVPLRLSALGVAAFLLAVAPAGVAATTNAPIAQTGGMTATLPLLGTPLTVAVTLDAVGNVSGVALDPSSALSKTKSGDDFVKFTNTDGSVKVSVKALGGQLSIKAKAKQLSDLLGSGRWSADVFGTGHDSSATYTVGKDASGNPTVAFGTVDPASGITWKLLKPVAAATVAPATSGKAKTDKAEADKGKGAHATAIGTFSWQGFTKTLTVAVNVNGSGAASLSITLTGRDAQKLSGTLASLAGARTWSAHLCDGTPVSVRYHVAADGTVVYDGATGAKATEKAFGDGFFAWFDKNRVALATMLVKHDDGTYSLLAFGRSGNCGHKSPGFFGFGHGHGPGHGQWSPPDKSKSKSTSH